MKMSNPENPAPSFLIKGNLSLMLTDEFALNECIFRKKIIAKCDVRLKNFRNGTIEESVLSLGPMPSEIGRDS